MMEETEANSGLGRRTLFKWLTRFFLSMWGVGVVGVVTSYVRGPASHRSAGLNFVSAGDEASLGVGQARLVRHGDSPLYVVRLPSGEMLAVSALCTHFSCVLDWNSENRTFECPCHDGTFSATGEVISGLPRKDLATHVVELRRGEIIVHL